METTKTKMGTAPLVLCLLGLGANLYGGVTFEGGVSLTQDTTFHGFDGTTKVSFDRGFRLDVTGGQTLPSGLGFDLDLGLIYSPMKRNPLVADSGNLDFYQIPMMLEVRYEIPLFGPVSAYLGGGIGAVYDVFTGSGTSILGFTTDVTFGYQGTAGIECALNDRWAIGVGYRFLGTTDHDLGSGVTMDGTLTHSLLATLSYKF